MRATLALNGLNWNPNFSESFFLLTLGFAGLVGALGYGVYAYKFRGPAMTTSRYLMRLRVTTLKVELLFFYFRVTTSKLENEKLLTQRRKIKNYTSSYQLEVQKSKVLLRVTKSKIKLFFFTFELLTRSGKIKSYTSSY